MNFPFSSAPTDDNEPINAGTLRKPTSCCWPAQNSWNALWQL